MNDVTSRGRMPAVFLGHGSPMNALEDNPFTRAWATLGLRVGKPRAILVVSAHWLTRGIGVTATEVPETIHDFGAFPQALFDVRYPAPGSPALAARVRELLAPLNVTLDHQWGFDHGTWSVLVHAYPDAHVPVVQLSIDMTKPHLYHHEVGRLLQPLRDEGVLIVGTGNVVHNLPRMDWGRVNIAYDWAERFQDFVTGAVTADTPQALIDYAAQGSDAALSIPSADHYLPLLYVLGARRADDGVRFVTPQIVHGSISMLSVVLEPSAA